MTIRSSDLLFLRECETVKRESHDPERQVGAVLVDDAGKIISAGANRPPEEMHLTVEISHLAIQQDPNWKYFMFEHAERNAIFGAEKLGKSVKGATMYCTLFPCADCARAIVAASVRRLVVEAPGPANPRDEKWQAHHHYALQILELSGVAIDYAAPKSVSAAAAPLD